jgi:D-cysteine desulfhydrase
VATALYARQLGYESMCFLSHQTKTPSAARALRIHLHNETQIVRYGGGRKSRVATLRQHLQQPGVFLIPPGGSNWLGAMGFVNAGMELAAQVAAGDVDEPTRLYVANGTMATAVGIALGLALSGSRTEVHAVQVTENFVSSPDTMRRLLRKTAYVMHQLDRSIPADLANRAHYRFRTGFLGEGYARTNAATDFAIATAREHLGLDLEATYTGKAMAALLDDLGALPSAESVMFWNTYNSRPLPAAMESSVPDAGLPDDFRRYID